MQRDGKRTIAQTRRHTRLDASPAWRTNAEQTDVRSYLEQEAFAEELILLAHAADGVVWGKFSSGKLRTSSDVFEECQATLAPLSLQMCRLFGPAGELFLWRNGTNWSVRRYLDDFETSGDATHTADTEGELAEETVEDVEYFDEVQILWGTQAHQAHAEKGGFTLVSDGVEGLLHAVPLEGIPFDSMETQEKRRPLQLTVRHYLQKNPDNGTVYIADSRLVRLGVDDRHRPNATDASPDTVDTGAEGETP